MKSIFSLVCLFLSVLSSYAQTLADKDPERIYSAQYNQKIEKGTYNTKSEDPTFIASSKNKIEGMVLKDTALINGNSLMYLAIDKPIVLFSKTGAVTSADVAGILNTSTLVDVDTVFYSATYVDSKDAPMTFDQWNDLISKDEDYSVKYPLSYNVWYAININNKKYYTDYKLHDFIEYNVYIPSKNQILLVCSQSTGYNGDYDLGYPDFYYVVVLQGDKDGWKQIYRSQKLDLNDGGSNEYGLSQLYPREVAKKGDNIEINFADYFTITWNGKTIKVEMSEITDVEDIEDVE